MSSIEEIDSHQLAAWMEAWCNQRKIVFYCCSGARSAQVCAFLQQQGFSQVFNLRAGIIAWYRQGYAIETLGLTRMAS